jgi:hypothetical protein
MAALLDWLVFGVAALAAGGTLSAVVVALFGPKWRDARTVPTISLEGPPSTSLMVPVESSGAGTVSVSVRNGRGRRTAQDVEVFLTVAEINVGDGPRGTSWARDRDPLPSRGCLGPFVAMKRCPSPQPPRRRPADGLRVGGRFRGTVAVTEPTG